MKKLVLNLLLKVEKKDINYIICKEIGKCEIVKVPFTEFCRLMEG